MGDASDDHDYSIVGLVRQVAHMEGMLTQALSTQATQLADQGKTINAVSNAHNLVSGIVGQHTVEIANMKVDITDITAKQSGFGIRVSTYVGPFLAVVAILVTIFIAIRN